MWSQMIQQMIDIREKYYQDVDKLLPTKRKDKTGKKRRFIQENKNNRPCADCGMSYPWYIMEYDHVRGTKSGTLTKMYRTHTMEEIIEEIEKCDIVCSNCHKHRTWVSMIGRDRVSGTTNSIVI